MARNKKVRQQAVKKQGANAPLASPSPVAGNSKTTRRRRNRNRAKVGTMGVVPQPNGVIYYRGEQPTVLSGEDLLADFTVTTNSLPGHVVISMPVQPQQWAGTHLCTLLSSYEQYRLKSVTFQISCNAPQQVGGGYLAGVTPDPDQLLEPGLPTRRYLRALAGSVGAPWVINSSVTMNPINKMVTTVVASATAENSWGKFMLAVDQPPVGVTANSRFMGEVSVHWTVELMSPSAAQPPRGDREWELNAVTGADLNTGCWMIPAAATKWRAFWEASHYDNVYYLSTPFAGWTTLPDKTDEASAAFIRTSADTSSNPFLVFFATIEDARKVGPSPSRGLPTSLVPRGSRTINFPRELAIEMSGSSSLTALRRSHSIDQVCDVSSVLKQTEFEMGRLRLGSTSSSEDGSKFEAVDEI